MKTQKLNLRDLSGILILWVLVCLAKFKYHGLILGLDYGLYQPDGIHYSFRTLTLLGHEPLSAAKEVADWYSIHASKLKEVDPASILPWANPNWGLGAPRLLYPILSVPFVYIFGMPGMLVIPALSLLTLMVFIYVAAIKLGRRNLGFLLVCAAISSPTILRWMVVNCTDALLAAQFCIAALILQKENLKIRNLSMILVLVITTSFTRFCFPIWLSIAFFVFSYFRQKFYSLLIVLFSIVCLIPALLLQPSNAVLPGLGDVTGLEKLIAVPLSFLKVFFFELAQLFVVDRVLLVLILVASLLAVKNFRRQSAQLYLYVSISVFIIGAINGTLGVNFRYQLPLLPFMFFEILDSCSASKGNRFEGHKQSEK